MTWNYRVTKVRYPRDNNSEPWEAYEIREVYYHEDGTIRAWSQDAMRPFGETWGELADDLDKMQYAVTQPVIDLTGEKPAEVAG